MRLLWNFSQNHLRFLINVMKSFLGGVSKQNQVFIFKIYTIYIELDSLNVTISSKLTLPEIFSSQWPASILNSVL